MEMLFVLLYWPVVGILLFFVTQRLLQIGAGRWWTILAIGPVILGLACAGLDFAVWRWTVHGFSLHIWGYADGFNCDRGRYSILKFASYFSGIFPSITPRTSEACTKKANERVPPAQSGWRLDIKTFLSMFILSEVQLG
jgi:hypothetical protein